MQNSLKNSNLFNFLFDVKNFNKKNNIFYIKLF